MEGYIIQSAEGTYLTKLLFWYDHEKPEAAFVHTKERLQEIREQSKTWDVPPALVYPATYSEGRVRVTGDAVPFDLAAKTA